MGIVDIALSQVGTKEKGINEVKYNDWYYGKHTVGGSFPWCAAFISWCANQAGIPSNVIKKTASVTEMMNFFKETNRFHPKGSGYIPKAGDILIQKSGGASHTGIVISADASGFDTVEGNASDQVKTKHYSYTDNKLTGFGSPNYSGNPMDGVPNIPSDYSNTGTGSAGGMSVGVGNYEYTNYTVKPNDTLSSIAKKYNTTEALIIFTNNLQSASVKAGQVLKVPTPPSGSLSGQFNSGVAVTKKHTTGIIVTHPVIEVEFYGEYGKLASVSATSVTSSKDVDKDIISVSTIRNMGQDCPTFSISLVWKNSWYKNLASNDLIVIKMQRPPESKQVVFVGLIDDIRKSTDYSSGQPQRTVQVTGRGFNKAFVNFDVGLVEEAPIGTGTGFFDGLVSIDSHNSYEAIKIVLDSYVGKAIKYSFGSGKLFEDYFQYLGNVHDNEILTNYMSYSHFNGSLWNFIKEIGNSPFNETFWEIQNDRPTMIHRRTPFNKDDWDNLHCITIKDLDIVSDNTGRSDLETYTLFSVHLAMGDETLNNVYMPLWYPPFYAKYGITQLAVQTSYQIWSSDTDNSVKGFFQDLFNFNIKNNVFANGTIVVKGSNQYKVGSRVIIESEGVEYYVESVSHNFNSYGSWTTSLGVTRGIEPENRFTAPWGCAEEMTPDRMNAIVKQTSGEKIDWANLPKVDYTTLYQDNNLESASNTSPISGTSGTASENEKAVYNVLKSWGLNVAAICAVLSNINSESAFDTNCWGDNHTSHGLCQWHNHRCTAMHNYCKSNGFSNTSVEGQMGYLKTELTGTYKKVWNTLLNTPNTAKGAYDAAYAWCVDFEKPAKMQVRGRERGENAKTKYYPKYNKGG